MTLSLALYWPHLVWLLICYPNLTLTVKLMRKKVPFEALTCSQTKFSLPKNSSKSVLKCIKKYVWHFVDSPPPGVLRIIWMNPKYLTLQIFFAKLSHTNDFTTTRVRFFGVAWIQHTKTIADKTLNRQPLNKFGIEQRNRWTGIQRILYLTEFNWLFQIFQYDV